MSEKRNPTHSIPSALLGNAERSPRSASPSVRHVQRVATAGAGTVEISDCQVGLDGPDFVLAQEEKTRMHISVEVCFVDPCDPDGAVAALRERGYQIDEIDDCMNDVQVQAIFIRVSRDVATDELSADKLSAAKAELNAAARSDVSADRYAAGGLVLDESDEIVRPFGGSSDNAG